MLYQHCYEGRGAASALYFDGETYSYDQIAEASARCAMWLQNLGIQLGDRVILSMPDSGTLAVTYFGVVASGAIAIVLDPRLAIEETFYVAQLCEARLAIIHDKLVGRLVGLRSLPGMKAVIGAGLTWAGGSELATAMAAVQRPDYVVRRNSTGHAYGLLSSGSTGRPKLIVHRHQDILHGYFGFARQVLGLTAADRVISAAKMTTGYGLGCSLLMPFAQGASAALVSEPPGSEVISTTIQEYGCTLLFAQPRFLADAISTPRLADRLRSLRLVITGGEPLGTALSNSWARFCPVELLDSYGNTEVGFLYISNRPNKARPNSVGKPIQGVSVEIVDQSGKPVLPGQLGQLRVRGPMVIDAYWNDRARTEQSFQDGWFVTSDMFSLDRDGYYYIHGRSDHMIKLGCGDWVNPNELEMVLLQHPSVRECAVVGAPDSDGLTVLKAFVVPEGRRPPSQALAIELGKTIKDYWPLQEYKRIHTVEFSSALPKTIAGKLDRGQLRPQSMTEFSYRC
ncbi:MAG: AMP-binding protein [Chloroflexi bacterium]|nr:AMP-binding protein [Chloroflexota bacterium]